MSARLPGTAQGLVLADYPGSWEAARELAGLAWDPVAEPVYALTGMDEQGPVYAQLDGWKRIARSDTGTTLSVNRDSYALIDHGEMGEIVEAVLELPHVRWETAGSLDERPRRLVSRAAGRAGHAARRRHGDAALPGDHQPARRDRRVHAARDRRAGRLRQHLQGRASSRESAPAPRTRSATSRAGATG